MVVSKYFVWFILFSFMGWLYETIYCTVSKHKWQNRGFLFGPVCPIYGVGAVAASIICSGSALPAMSDVQIFFVCFFGSIVLEYVTSWVLEKLFHAIWWDYSKVKFNIHGRVCLPASIGFGLAGLLVVHVILPFARHVTGGLSPLTLEVLSLLFMAVFAADFALTVSALTSLMQNLQAVEEQVNKQMEELYASLEDNLNEKKLLAIERKDEWVSQVAERKQGFTAAAAERKQGFTAAVAERKQGFTAAAAERKQGFTAAAAEKKQEFTAAAAEKKEELTNTAVETMTRLLNLGQRHALHSVKEFHYDEHTSRFSSRLIQMEQEIREKAKQAKNAATAKAGAVKEKMTEKTEKQDEEV